MSKEMVREEIKRTGIRRGEDSMLISTRGARQNWLIDLRPLFLRRDVLCSIADAFWDTYEDRDGFQIAAVETAAIPLLAAIIMRAPEGQKGINYFIVRKERKTTGTGGLIEGKILKDKVVLVDDILNSGSSAEKARVVIENSGVEISDIFVVVDFKSERSVKWRSEHMLAVTSLFVLPDLGLALGHHSSMPTQRYSLKWKSFVSAGFPFYVVPKSTPLLVGELIYRGCDEGRMHAFKKATGEIVWEYSASGVSGRKGIWSSPAYFEGKIYFGAYNGVFYCLDAATGRELWTRSYGEWIGSSPLVVPKHNLVYIGLEYERPWARGSICALRADTGAKVWEYPTSKYQHGSASYWDAGDLIVWGTADHVMLGIQAATGQPVWAFKTKRSVKYAPAIDSKLGIVAFSSFDKSIYVLDVATGRKLGQWETGEICYTTPLIRGDRLFCGSGDRYLYVIDLSNMKLIKKISFGARIYSSPISLKDSVIFGTSGGRVVEIDPISLEVKGILQLPDAITNAIVPDSDERTIFISTYMNQLYAYGRQAEAA